MVDALAALGTCDSAWAQRIQMIFGFAARVQFETIDFLSKIVAFRFA